MDLITLEFTDPTGKLSGRSINIANTVILIISYCKIFIINDFYFKQLSLGVVRYTADTVVMGTEPLLGVMHCTYRFILKQILIWTTIFSKTFLTQTFSTVCGISFGFS